MSSYVSADSIKTIKRYSKEKKGRVDVPIPKIIAEYNTLMGGVDLSDVMLVALYRTGLKIHK